MSKNSEADKKAPVESSDDDSSEDEAPPAKKTPVKVTPLHGKTELVKSRSDFFEDSKSLYRLWLGKWELLIEITAIQIKFFNLQD